MLLPGFADAPFPPLLLLLAALALDAVIGGRAGPLGFLPHPVRLIGGLITGLETGLDRTGQRNRKARGILTVLVVCACAGAVGVAMTGLSRTLPLGWLVELALAVSLLAQRSLFVHVRAVARALRPGRPGGGLDGELGDGRDGGLAAGREAVGHIVGRDVRRLDEAGVARAAIESCFENFSDGVAAPVFWYVLAGAPGLLVYKAVNTMDSMIGHKSERYRAYGWAAARLDDLLNLIPARLAGLFIVGAAAILPGADARAAGTVMRRDARKHRSPNAGWPEGAAAGALGLALSGPRAYEEAVANEPWIGHGRAAASAADIDRALDLYTVACLLNAGAVAALALAPYAAP